MQCTCVITDCFSGNLLQLSAPSPTFHLSPPTYQGSEKPKYMCGIEKNYYTEYEINFWFFFQKLDERHQYFRLNLVKRINWVYG